MSTQSKNPKQNIIENINDLKKFTIFIKSYVSFQRLNKKIANIPDSIKGMLLKECRFKSDDSVYKFCPIFGVDTILSETNSEFNSIFQYGGVISIYLNWNCDFDWNLNNFCLPEYKFERQVILL
uniref:P2X purinoceptor 1 (Trinotate prediction) n=1 Tax=Myxobolus squamalis TaxID=59785 RepID=A0A6B2FZ31_MYXSQ